MICENCDYGLMEGGDWVPYAGGGAVTPKHWICEHPDADPEGEKCPLDEKNSVDKKEIEL
jgi:hypothetical protein